MNDWTAHTRITGTIGGDCGHCGREDVELDEDDICEDCYYIRQADIEEINRI